MSGEQFTISGNNGRSHTFAVGVDFTFVNGRRYWSLNGLNALCALGLWAREIKNGELKTQPPDIETVMAMGGGTAPAELVSAAVKARPPLDVPVPSSAAAPKPVSVPDTPVSQRSPVPNAEAMTPDQVAASVNGRGRR